MREKKADCTFFSNVECEYWPCHGLEDQNCLFCYCPLYAFDCGGDFTLTHGVKDCSACLKVHEAGGYEFVTSELRRRFPLKG
jgi:Zn-finger protein